MGKIRINPFKFFYNVSKGAKKRIADKGLEGNLVKALFLGGVLIFDAQGMIQYAYQE
jgi:hypothetical protein